MQYAYLGKSPLRISAIGFGCMSLGKDVAENTRLIHRALELGINFFDTADLYDKGLNEEMVGKILRSKREQVVLATKVGNRWRSDGSGWDWDPRKEYIVQAVEASLARLQTDRIDLYQLHGGTMEDPVDEVIEAFELLQQQGKIRCCGISSIRPRVIREYITNDRNSNDKPVQPDIREETARSGIKFGEYGEEPLDLYERIAEDSDRTSEGSNNPAGQLKEFLGWSGVCSVMLPYSLLDRRAEESVLPFLREKGVGVLARGTLAKGLLADKPAAAYLNYGPAEITRLTGVLYSLSGTNRSCTHPALEFVLSNPTVTSAITGLRTMQQLEEVAGVMDGSRLTEKEMEMLRGILPVNLYDQDR